jgi:hypothetical protein
MMGQALKRKAQWLQCLYNPYTGFIDFAGNSPQNSSSAP